VPPLRRLGAEALGSLFLLAGVVGSGIMGETQSFAGIRLEDVTGFVLAQLAGAAVALALARALGLWRKDG